MREERKILFEGKYRRFVLKDGWEFTERVGVGGIVAILAVTDQNKLLLIEQHRIPVGCHVIELPAGLAGDSEGCRGESLEAAARRELLEETGYEAGKLVLIGKGPASSAVSSDVIHLYRALDVRKVAEGGGDATESIKVHEVALEHFDEWVRGRQREGYLVDPKIFTALYLLMRNY
ncbi:MAG: NUDIX hydrolase [Candidatus Omnitrophica bacterium]|nr:NUDIX hydrolase [Candidatus Omnitrophota bacterium]